MKYFFGIGINAYEHVSPLFNAVKDVQDVAELLIRKYDFEQAYTQILIDDRATRSEIIDTLERYRNIITEYDSLLIYYSGHGFRTVDNRGYWVPSDGRPDSISTFIPNESIRSYMHAIISKHTLLISDSCFSGSMIRDVVPIDLAMEDLDKRKSRWVFSSGREDQPVSDGAKGENSPFANAILSELENNTAPLLGIQILGSKVLVRTRNAYQQLPEICPLLAAGDEGGQFIFRLKSDQKKCKYDTSGDINPINDELEWYLAAKNDTLDDYKRYILSFSSGRFVELALDKIQQFFELKHISTDILTKISSSAILPYTKDLLFIFGKPAVGKTVLIATLIKFLKENFANNVLFERADEGGQLIKYFDEVLSEKMFPYRTVVGPPTEIKLTVCTEQGNSYPLSILEVSGEEYMRLIYNDEVEMASYLENYLRENNNFIFVLVIETNHESDSDTLTSKFINYVVSNCTYVSFILLFSKNDLRKNIVTPEMLLQSTMPLTLHAFNSHNCNYTLTTYSIGKIADNAETYNLSESAPNRLWNKYLDFRRPLS